MGAAINGVEIDFGLTTARYAFDEEGIAESRWLFEGAVYGCCRFRLLDGEAKWLAVRERPAVEGIPVDGYGFGGKPTFVHDGLDYAPAELTASFRNVERLAHFAQMLDKCRLLSGFGFGEPFVDVRCGVG